MKKKDVLITAGVAAVTVLSALGISKLGKIEPRKYSDRFFRGLSDEALHAEREIARVNFCASGNDNAKALYWERILRLIDGMIRLREPSSSTPQPPSYHR